jgi:hypothetical protein
LEPPKPKPDAPALRGRPSRLSFQGVGVRGTMKGLAGSCNAPQRRRMPGCGGMQRWRIASASLMMLATPAAHPRWPKMPLTLPRCSERGVCSGPKNSVSAASSVASPTGVPVA